MSWRGPHHAERTYQVEVPAGVDTGATLRLSQRGAVGARGGVAGDLYVHIRVAAHERYEREENDLVTHVPISIAKQLSVLSLRLQPSMVTKSFPSLRVLSLITNLY